MKAARMEFNFQNQPMVNRITCPHCKKQIELSEALTNQLQEQATVAAKAEYEKKLEEVKEQIFAESERKTREQFELQMKRIQEDAVEKDSRIKQFIEQITELSKELRQIKKEKDEVKLEMEKKLALEEDKIRLEEKTKAEEEQRLKILEKEKQLKDALRANEEMRRKLQQGSQQTQGEAFELEFEQLLQRQYPNDKIIPVAKGVRGADLIQEVWDGRGNYTGKILWELKNTKTWSEPWVEKLKDDKRAIKADEAVLISAVIPNNMKTAGFRNGIWVTQRDFVFTLADTLRAKLIQMYYVKNSVHAKDEKMEILYTYLSGTEFKNRIEAIIEAFTNMQQEIEKEKRYFVNKWARDEKNIRKVIDSTYGMHGDLKGIIGGALPQIKGLELLESGEESS